MLNKSCLLAMRLCCLHSQNNRHMIYEHRVLHSHITLGFTAFLLPRLILNSSLLHSSNASNPPAYSDPPAIGCYIVLENRKERENV